MDSNQAGAGSNNSSDFVSKPPALRAIRANAAEGTEVVQVRGRNDQVQMRYANARDRMLENPSDESVVRWGNDGDSFVVLEVRPINARRRVLCR
jgi:hypothetical protein